MFSSEVIIIVFVTSSETSLIEFVTGSKTSFISSCSFCFPSLVFNLNAFTWLCNENNSIIISKCQLYFQLNSTFMLVENVSFQGCIQCMSFWFHWNYYIYLHFVFTHENTKIVKSFTPSFTTHVFKFITTHIISSYIFIHTFNISYGLPKQYYSITAISNALSR